MKIVKQISIFFFLLFVIGCSSDELVKIESIKELSLADNITIEINTSRTYGEGSLSMGAKTRSSDPFTEIREVESSESVVLPELQPHIWIGNILTKNSVANCNYKPLIYPREPINVTLTLSGATPKMISTPSYSSFMQYIQEQTAIGSFSQNSEFSFTTEQFTSYNELKVVFGSNVNTQVLFWGSQSGSQTEDRFISKATGLYVKFYQTSFKAVMDYPQGQIASIPANMLDSAVYVNSISFGRLGIMALETNSAAEYSKTTINRVFQKLFSSGSSTLTTEETNFLNGCSFKVYLIAGNSSTAVETFTGFDGFIQHIKKGDFSRSEPGTPLFCTFNHVKDNTPVKVNFKFNIKKEPLYVELVHKPKSKPYDWHNISDNSNTWGYGDLYLYFYRNMNKVPAIADPRVKIKLKVTHNYQDFNYPKTPPEISEWNQEYQNSSYQTSMLILSNRCTKYRIPGRISGPPHDRETDRGGMGLFNYEIVGDGNFVIIGTNPINFSNTSNQIK